ncbi:unnamed protein product [Cylicostephanus goldi]|uniref:Uncharacterized protein n=1 Tax=Cylicostephanus goldi TaxID=71465 RepID=A0A3P6QXL8_CYLGO|nr:unnamed protein product [Cylicostephanus goldi]
MIYLQIPLILIFLLGFVIAFVLLITCIVVLICRWRSPPSDPPANSKIWLAACLLTICAVVTIVCLVLIGTSTNAISDGLDYLPDQLSKSATGVCYSKIPTVAETGKISKHKHRCF